MIRRTDSLDSESLRRAMFESSSLSLLAVASLAVAGLHVLYSFIMGTLTRSAWTVVAVQREEIRLARVRQVEAEQAVVAARRRLDDLQLSAVQLERKFDRDCDDKLSFELVLGRAGPGLTPYRGRIERRGIHGRGRDSLVWDHAVHVVIWANSIERARVLLADAFSRAKGYATAIDVPLPETIREVEGSVRARAG